MTIIKRLREKKGLTQMELASAIDVSQASVALWEGGACFPRPEKLPRLAKVLGCTIDDLFSDEK